MRVKFSVFMFCATVILAVAQNSGHDNGYEWVDLGLPSGVRWSTCNVGAQTPEDYGNLYAWGETRDKDVYSESLFYGVNIGDFSRDVRYDVASRLWGDNWRVPTAVEWQELIDNCLLCWTTYNGVAGYKITSKNNNNSIFLPAVGAYYKFFWDGKGSVGGYWSSTPVQDDSYENALMLAFNSSGYVVEGRCRDFGLPIRPVNSPLVDEIMPIVTEMSNLDEEDENDIYKYNNGASVRNYADQMPVFPGGDAALMNYIENNIRYPEEARRNGVEGSVILGFIITELGEIEYVEVLRSSNKMFEEEAIRLVLNMPRWTPAIHGGKAVSMYYTLPVKFRLQ